MLGLAMTWKSSAGVLPAVAWAPSPAAYAANKNANERATS